MAKQYGKNSAVDFAPANLMSFGKSFATLNGQPIVKSEAWYDFEALQAFALTDSAYVGQKVFYVDVENNTVTHYSIEIDGSLKELGSATAGDGKSIDLGDGNILSLKNFGKKYYKYVPATEDAEATYELVEDGTFPAGLQPKTRLADDGTIELAWYEPSSTTVEGLSEQMSSLTQTVNTMQTTVSANTAALEKKVDAEEGKGLSTEDYTSEEKEKLGSVSANAKDNVIEGIKVNGVDQKPDGSKKVDITVPTTTSELTNDSDFVTSTVNNLVNYYKSADTYNKTEIDNLISSISTIDILVVESLPTENISHTTIYLVPKSDSETSDVYDEYIYVSSKSSWEMIGNTVIDLSNYLQKTGDASSTTVTFTSSDSRIVPVTGETLAVIIGKVVKYLADLKAVAFSGSYNDLADKPANITAYLADVLLAGNTEVTISIPEGGTLVNVMVKDSEGSIVLTDVEVNAGSVTVSVSEALDFDLSILLTYYK